MGEIYGITGKNLYIDLTKGEVKDYDISEKNYRDYLGGRGLGAKILFNELPMDTDPLGPDNVMVITTGPLNGLPFFGVKHVVNTKSPLTGNYLDSYGGGHFSAELKYAGYDTLIIKGKAAKLVYLYIKDDQVEIRDASFLKGKGVFETEELLKEAVKDKEARVISIGPAGENLVRYAHIAIDLHHACGRGGGGAVLGSKNLKAIVVRGTKGLNIAEPQNLMNFINNEIESRIKAKGLVGFNHVRYGKAWTMEHTQRVGMLPTRNFQYTQYKDQKLISGPYLRENHVVNDKGCFACNMPCGFFSKTNENGKYAGAKVAGPHYEANCLFGSNLENNNMDAVIMANYLSNDLGVDYISAGVSIGFAMECFEKGIISEKDTGGINLKFGDVDSALAMLKKIIYREDIGDVLAEGVKIASQKIGQETEKFAIHGKGMEAPAYDPRGIPGLALAYAISDRGFCHRRLSPAQCEPYHKDMDFEEVAIKTKKLYDARIPAHCGAICDTTSGQNTGLTLQDFGKIFSMATGWDMDEGEMQTLCERVSTMCLVMNLREGAPFTKEDNLNCFPYRLTDEPVPEGPSKGRTVDKKELDIMLTKYYELRGWDTKTGIPTEDTMKNLSLDKEMETLKKIERFGGVFGG